MSGAGRRVREGRTAGEKFLGGAGGPDGGLLCEEGGGELTVVGVLVGHFDGEVEAGAVGGGERGRNTGTRTDLASS